MKLLIINGPNLNLLGTREPEIYGSRTFESYLKELREMLEGEKIEYLQSNHEGDIIDFLHNADCDGIILNAGAYTHTSLAIADAIRNKDSGNRGAYIQHCFTGSHTSHFIHCARVPRHHHWIWS